MDEDNEGSKFSEEDIETILQRRTQTIILVNFPKEMIKERDIEMEEFRSQG